MFKAVEKLFKGLKETMSEIVAGIVVISTVLVASMVGVIASLLAFLFCTPIGWVLLIILALKHC